MNPYSTGFGNIIPPTRRWESGVPVGAGRVPCASCTSAAGVRNLQQDAARGFFVPPPDYGMSPRSDRGTPQSALRGLGSFWSSINPFGGCSNDDTLALKAAISSRLARLSPGIKATAESLLASTEASGTCEENMGILQQALGMAINDLRAQAGVPPKTAEEQAAAVQAGADVSVLKSYVPMSDTTKYLIAGGVAVGVMLLLSGGAAFLGRGR